MKFFRPEDFTGILIHSTDGQLKEIADKANAKLEAESQVVYTNESHTRWSYCVTDFSDGLYNFATHKGRVIDYGRMEPEEKK